MILANLLLCVYLATLWPFAYMTLLLVQLPHQSANPLKAVSKFYTSSVRFIPKEVLPQRLLIQNSTPFKIFCIIFYFPQVRYIRD